MAPPADLGEEARADAAPEEEGCGSDAHHSISELALHITSRGADNSEKSLSE